MTRGVLLQGDIPVPAARSPMGSFRISLSPPTSKDLLFLFVAIMNYTMQNTFLNFPRV